MAIEIEGKKYKVVENLGFNNRREQYAKVVQTEDGERVAVRDPGRGMPWKFAQPLVVLTGSGPATGQSA